MHSPGWFAVSYNGADSTAAVPSSETETAITTPATSSTATEVVEDMRPIVVRVPWESFKPLYQAISDGVCRLQATTSPVNVVTDERLNTATSAVYSKPAYEPSRFWT